MLRLINYAAYWLQMIEVAQSEPVRRFAVRRYRKALQRLEAFRSMQ